MVPSPSRGPARGALARLDREVAECRRCARLVAWRARVARERRAAFREETYWGRGVPGFGPADARMVVVGLAPAAHGANRTGRVFTGDESGRWLFRALHRAGFANRAESVRPGDGLELRDARVTSVVRCAPPGNRPTTEEARACSDFLQRELTLLRGARLWVALGGFAWSALLRALRDAGHELPRPLPRFGHGAEVELGPTGPTLLASYHPSQQNTRTGRLTEPMLDAVFGRAARLLRPSSRRARRVGSPRREKGAP